MRKLLFMAVAALSILCGCKSKNTAGSGDAPEKVLVVYYSQTGATKAVAEEIQKQLACDIVPIVPEQPYDGDYPATIQRWMKEKADSVKVAIHPVEAELGDYDVIFLGFPIWGGTYASPVATFLADNSLKGKKVVTFATFGSGGIDNATADVVAAQPGAEVVKGYGVRNARVAKAAAEISRFLIENGWVEGEVEPLPDYSESMPVDDAAAGVFHAACDNYQFPLGTPVKVAKRTVGTTTDYRYDVISRNPDGKEIPAVIYVTAPEGQTPEFTEVVRP